MSKRVSMIVLAAALSVAAVPTFGAPLQTSEVHPTATWVAHIDMEAFRASDIGKMVMAELQKQGLDQKFESFATIFSFHPLRDLRNVTLYGRGADRDHAVAVVNGKLDTQKLLAFVRLNPQHQEIPYKGGTIHRWRHETDQMLHGFVHDESRVVVGAGQEAVQQAVDALKGQATGTATNLFKQIPEGRGRVFLQAAATGIGDIAGQNPQAAVLRQTDSLALTVGEATENVFGELSLLGQTTEGAENMNQTLLGIFSMFQLMGGEQPQLAELAKSIRLSVTDRTIRIRFEMVSKSLFEMIKTQWEQQN